MFGLDKKQNKDAQEQLGLLYYVVIGLGSALLVLASVEGWSPLGIPPTFFKDLGIAGIVALIVILTVEKQSRDRHERAANTLVKRINENLFHAIYNRYVPEVVLAEVEKLLMKASIYRTDHEINYTIEGVKDGEGPNLDCSRHVRCQAQSRYTLHNVSEGLVTHDVVTVLERPIDPDWESECKIEEVSIGGIPLTEDVIKAHTSDTPEQFKFSYPLEVTAGERVEISTSSRLIKRRLDIETWASRLPSDGLKLTVSVPNKDLDVRAFAHHSEPLKEILNNAVTKSWELKYGVFPYQSVSFWWRPR